MLIMPFLKIQKILNKIQNILISKWSTARTAEMLFYFQRMSNSLCLLISCLQSNNLNSYCIIPQPGMTMQSTKFSRSSKEGRGDTSVWTDTPSDRAQKAKIKYLYALFNIWNAMGQLSLLGCYLHVVQGIFIT